MAAPQQPGAASASARRTRNFSLGGRSEKTHRSSSSADHNKIQLTPSAAEEQLKRNFQTKADPMIAMSEAQPMTVALEKSTIGSLREMQHKDQFGNIITDPDLSNPTRPRLERPLDTIRSFEAAIYGSSRSRPVSYAKTEEPTPEAGYSRRSSYFGGPTGGHANSYYGGRGTTYSRPDSYAENGYSNGPPPESYYPFNQGGGRPRRHPRMNSEHTTYGPGTPNVYSQNGYGKSYENMATASGSGSGSASNSNNDQWGNSTDPSSVNSSIDQLQQQQYQARNGEKTSTVSDYGFQFGPSPNFDSYGNNGINHSGGRIQLGGGAPPATVDPNVGGPVGGGGHHPPAAPAGATRRHLRKSTNASEASDGGKRKSWFKRRFSKNS